MDFNTNQEFSTFNVMDILNLKRERLREWMKIGYAIPTKPADGPGTKAIFSLLDVYSIALFKQLVDIGMHREQAMLYMENIRDLKDYDSAKELNYIIFLKKHHVLNDKIIIIKGTNFNLEEIDKDMSGEDGWSLGIIINFKNLMDEVHDAIRSL